MRLALPPARAVVLCLAVVLSGISRAAAEDAPGAVTEEVASAFRDLDSPLRTTREAAVRRLVAALPASRGPVLRALRDAPESVRVHLVEVLAQDRSAEGLRALLAELSRGSPYLGLQIEEVLIRDPDATRRVLEAWAVDPALRQDDRGHVSERVRELERILRRAEAERLFRAHKSASGYTGSYRGQYADLLPYREEALDLCVGILADRAVPVPGRYTTGGFEWLTPPTERLDFDEAQSMAASAFAELGRPTDTRHLDALEGLLLGLNRRLLDEEGLYDDVLLALVIVRGNDQDQFLLQGRLLELAKNPFGRRRLSRYAAMLLRLDRYAEAIAAYKQVLDDRDEAVSAAHAHYNIACAYARWAESLEGGRRAANLRLALRELEAAVDAQWSDVRWMEQDRDLDLLRELPGYQTLVERIRREVQPPPSSGGR